jgi:hypothetical protein
MAIRIDATPLAAGNPSYISAPSRLIHSAIALAIEAQSDPSPFLDEAFDLLAGFALTIASHANTATGAASTVGFGFTMPPIGGSYEAYIVALYGEDDAALRARESCNSMQVRLANRALAALAKQFASEAEDDARSPLDRARRVRAAIMLDADSTFAFAADAASLAEYADACRLDDDDGRLAWAMFGFGEQASATTTPKQAKANAQADASSFTRINSTDESNGAKSYTMAEDENASDARAAKREAAYLAADAAEAAASAADDANPMMSAADAKAAKAKRARERKAAAAKQAKADAKANAKAASNGVSDPAAAADEGGELASLASDVLADAAVSQTSAGSTSTKCKPISIDA